MLLEPALDGWLKRQVGGRLLQAIIAPEQLSGDGERRNAEDP